MNRWRNAFFVGLIRQFIEKQEVARPFFASKGCGDDCDLRHLSSYPAVYSRIPTMRFSCPTCSQLMECAEGLADTKVKCAKCGQRILVPTPPPQTKAGTNKTTLGKIVEDDKTTSTPVAASPPPPPPSQLPPAPAAPPAPMVSAAPVEEEPRKKKKHRKSSRHHDEYEDEFDDEYDRDGEDERGIRVRCPFCRKKGEPYIREQISQQGWIVFAVILFFFFQLCWIGLLMKEKARFCRRCHSRVDRGGFRF
jgi:DNA-directed RNA polymerase subunit RPC12/RpoP